MDYTTPPTDLNAVRLYRLERIREQLCKHNYAGILLFDPLNTRYATDSTNMQIWCTHFETRCVLVITDGPTILFDYADYPFLAEGLPTIDEYKVMDAFYYFATGANSSDWAAKFGKQIHDEMSKHAGGNKRLAIDRLSHQGTDAIRSHGYELFDGQEVTEIARSIKSDGEVILMKAAIDVCDIGMRAMEDALVPGVTENALWAKLHEANIANGGEWIETRLLASGQRTNPWFQESSMRPIEAGDMVSFDTDLVGPYGYCADISRAWVCGTNPTAEQKELYKCAHEQVEYNMSILKPGMTFQEVTEASWPIPEKYQANRYGCLAHGVGLADEYPSIAYLQDLEGYGYPGTVEPNMVLSVESFIGLEGGEQGVKLEQMVLVTEDGIELLSHYPLDKGLLGD
ncbi:MAG: aminopeptidase P family protein [Rhodobacteraceae bacterium]|nr:aminopeptidase P family protein [Paracoccaceae bacterium]